MGGSQMIGVNIPAEMRMTATLTEDERGNDLGVYLTVALKNCVGETLSTHESLHVDKAAACQYASGVMDGFLLCQRTVVAEDA
jgi:hypothetical protein